jgi:hypothetical protein
LKEAQAAASDIMKHQKLEGREDYKRLQSQLLSMFRKKLQEIALN